MAKLITELNEEVNILCESNDAGKKSWFVEGIYLQSNIKNRNGRVYPTGILEKEVARYNKDYVLDNRAVGELGHPDGPSINQDRVSHKIVELRQDGDNFIGRAKILNTPMGKIVQEFLDENIKIGVSSRGIGTLKENRSGFMEVQNDFYLATAADIVHDPSAPSAFVNGIMEGVEWLWDNGAIKSVEAAENAVKQIEEATRSRELDAQKKRQIFENYIKSFLN
jgi:Prohead core protein serine protease